jgi:hypothetical protein
VESNQVNYRFESGAVGGIESSELSFFTARARGGQVDAAGCWGWCLNPMPWLLLGSGAKAITSRGGGGGGSHLLKDGGGQGEGCGVVPSPLAAESQGM